MRHDVWMRNGGGADYTEETLIQPQDLISPAYSIWLFYKVRSSGCMIHIAPMAYAIKIRIFSDCMPPFYSSTFRTHEPVDR